MSEAASEGRRERRKRQLRARIYETARKLFLEHGFEATTVAQIAEAADIAPGTFFNHFAGKQALLQEISNEVSDYLQALVDQQLARPVPVLDRIGGFADAVVQQLSPARGLARDVLLELMRTSARPGEAYPYLARLHDPFTGMLREGQDKGEVRDDLEAGFLAEMVVGTLHVAITNWLVDPEYPLEERLLQTAAFVREAIQPRAPAGAPDHPPAVAGGDREEAR